MRRRFAALGCVAHDIEIAIGIAIAMLPILLLLLLLGVVVDGVVHLARE